MGDEHDDNGVPEPELGIAAHRFSMEAFALAKALVSGSEAPETLKAKAVELQERLPVLSSQLPSAPQAERPDINRALADARLDLAYVMADGNLPSSIRLYHFAAGR